MGSKTPSCGPIICLLAAAAPPLRIRHHAAAPTAASAAITPSTISAMAHGARSDPLDGDVGGGALPAAALCMSAISPATSAPAPARARIWSEERPRRALPERPAKEAATVEPGVEDWKNRATSAADEEGEIWNRHEGYETYPVAHAEQSDAV